MAHLVLPCPYKEGNAVYLARVILHGFEDKEYLNKCEIVEPANNNERRANFGEEKNSEIKKLEITSNPSLQTNDFSISPNPNNGKFLLICPSNSSFNYEFISITGQVLKSESVQNKNSVDFDFSHLSKGIYNLKITSLLTVKTIKISIH